MGHSPGGVPQRVGTYSSPSGPPLGYQDPRYEGDSLRQMKVDYQRILRDDKFANVQLIQFNLGGKAVSQPLIDDCTIWAKQIYS